jgi:microcystin-dependent protein
MAVPQANTTGGTADPTNNLWGGFVAGDYSASAPASQMAPGIQPAGGSQPHDNMPPFAVISFIISLFGIYPTPT